MTKTFRKRAPAVLELVYESRSPGPGGPSVPLLPDPVESFNAFYRRWENHHRAPIDGLTLTR